uniref:Uncharacterized protein n=1 Tax=Anguilla anguilla TaxID=7936 RepID=A0A0E9W6H1_ANGAN
MLSYSCLNLTQEQMAKQANSLRTHFYLACKVPTCL